MLRFLAALVIAVLVSGPGLAADKTLKLAATEYPPFYGKELKDHGFITEIIATAFERSGYQINVKFLPWKRALEKTKDGAYDGVFVQFYPVIHKYLPADVRASLSEPDSDSGH